MPASDETARLEPIEDQFDAELIDAAAVGRLTGDGVRALCGYVRLDASAEIATSWASRFLGDTRDAGQHPLDLLREDQVVVLSDGRRRGIPTALSVAANTWHYLLSRRLEIAAFSNHPVVEVIDRDVERAAGLAGDRDSRRLRTLAEEVRSA